MKKFKLLRWILIPLGILVILFALDQLLVGIQLDEYRGVPVYYNGRAIARSHGKHRSPEGYHWGYKWQCVEFVKRFYDQVHGHQMPNVYGHAKDFFDKEIGDGWNKDRNMRQFRNGNFEAPQADDLIVFDQGTYGHVAIVSEVDTSRHEIEWVQQNKGFSTRDRQPLVFRDGAWFIGGKRRPVGWLRIKPPSSR